LPKIVDRKKRKIEILSASIDTFYTFGMEKTSMKQIAEGLGIGRSSLYSYFTNRDEILHASFEYAVAEFNSIKKQILESELTIPERIFQLLSATLSNDSEIKKVMVIVLDYLARLQRLRKKIDPLLISFSHQIQELFKELLRQGIERGELIKHNVDNMSFILYSLSKSFLFQKTFYGELDSYTNIKSLQLVLKGIIIEKKRDQGGLI